MSIEQASPIVPIKPQVALQNSAFIKNSHNRSSFCGVVPSPTNGNATLKTFAVNRKSWSGNGTLSLQSYTVECVTPSTPELATFKGTGTFPRNRERNNNYNGNGIVTPNGNTTQIFRSEVRRTESGAFTAGRRYAEIGNWNKRNSTFLEPHLQGVGVRGPGEGRDSRSSESDTRDDRSTATEDEERALLRRTSPRVSARLRRSVRRNDNSPPFRGERLDNAPDSPDAPLKPREFFERLQSQAMREEAARESGERGPPQPAPRAPLSTFRDSLSQSRETLSSDGEGARGDCSSVGSSGSASEPQPPCDIGLLERLIRTHPVWFLPGIQRAGAFHLLQGKEEGNFVVRQSSQVDTMAISVRLPQDKGPYIEHYLIQANGGRIGLETSQNKFDNIPELIAYYSQCCDELPVQLALPRPLRDAKNRHQLNSLALLGQEFWGYPMANPKTTQSLLSPGQLANEVMPMAITPSDTGSSLSSFNAGVNNNNQTQSPELEKNGKATPMESGSPLSQNQILSTFKGCSAPSPSDHKNATFVRAPRPTPPNTLNLMSSTNTNRLSPEGECISSIAATLHGSFKRQFTEQHTTEPGSPQDTNTESADPVVNSNSFSKSNSLNHNQVPSPNGSNSVTSGIFSPTSQITSPNETVSSKSGVFSPLSQITNKSEVFSPISRSSPMSAKNVFSPISNQSFTNSGSCLMGKDRDKLLSPNTNNASSTPSGRSRRSKHSTRKESRHYQESDILESPGVYYRSSLMDKVSDYEDIWGPEANGNCTTFKPAISQSENGKGIMMSKRPDLLPDTLPKLNAAKSTQSILEKENILILASNDSLNKKHMDQDSMTQNFKSSHELISKFNNSSELIATTNSRGEVVPKRPDQLSLIRNANKLISEEVEAGNKENADLSMDISQDDFNNSILDDSEKGKAGSPFYADPVDAIKEATAMPLVQRRKALRVGVGALAQRYSEPPTNHPYYPLRDMHSIEELSPSSPNTSNSVDNLILRTNRPKIKPVLPPRINGKPPPMKNDATWTVDSSWEFINKNEDQTGSESGTFPSLAEQESRLGVEDSTHLLTVHHIVAQRIPELRLHGAPATLAEEIRVPPRASCYDNVLDHRPISEQASDDGTVFSEPWDCAQWDGLLPPTNHLLGMDGDEEREWESPVSSRKPLAAISRAKSFRDRLDPLLAAGRVRALRGGRGSRGAGAALRAYALHLAQDKSTTFAQNVDHFIACTLDSKEICPQIVMRNMRQFMSGMKNYLVKHGEREFEKEVEKERMKLKSTEFLNLDAILEAVMHRLVVRPLRSRLYTLLADWHASDVRALHAAIQNAADATPLQMGIKASTNIPPPTVMATISKHFLKMQEADSPLDKLENLLAAISAIFNSIRVERALGADDLLPMLAWVVARCRLVCAELEAELMAGLLPPALLAGEGGYYLTALFSAVAVLKKLAPDQPQDPATLWRRSSLETSNGTGQACVVRVALPDECRGSIRRVALPCRPGARARDLCRALAHQAAITNPQDYALFALHNGQETILADNDCPQEVMSEKNGKNCILAYKRIDAKIAWPQQALMSLP